jgi:hypothetical protein
MSGWSEALGVSRLPTAHREALAWHRLAAERYDAIGHPEACAYHEGLADWRAAELLRAAVRRADEMRQGGPRAPRPARRF